MGTAYINLERFGVQFQDRINRLVNIDPEQTAFLSMIQKSEAYDDTVRWQTHTLAAASESNAGVQGANVTYASGDYVAPASLFNYTQIPQKTFSSSFSYDQAKKPEIGSGPLSGFNAEKVRKLKELKRDINANMLSNRNRVQPLPESTQAGESRGAQFWITSNIIDAETQTNRTKYGNQMLGIAMLDNINQLCVDNGGSPDTILANSTNRIRINNIVGGPSRDVDSLGRRIQRMIDVITSIAGDQTIIFERQLAQSTLLVMEMKYWEQRWFREPQTFIAGLLGSRTEGWVEAEYTLVSYAEKSSGKIINLK